MLKSSKNKKNESNEAGTILQKSKSEDFGLFGDWENLT